MINQSREKQKYQNMMNNAKGHSFEMFIKGACRHYKVDGVAEVDKMPEPFRVRQKYPDGSFVGRFTALAQPDFQGTVKGGRSIVFEAKYTSTDRMRRAALTEEQMKSLEAHYKLGAIAGICCCIQDAFFFIPWEDWRDMKQIYGRQYIQEQDVEHYRIRFNGQALFLDYIHEETKKELEERIKYGSSER